MTFVIRAAAAQDLPDIVRLSDVIQRQYAEAYPGDFLRRTDAEDVSDFFERLLGDESQEVLLATRGDETVAYLWHQIQRPPPNPFTRPLSRVFVHHILVDPSYRRQGVAGLLFEHVQDAAERDGHSEIALDTWAANTEAQAFFES